MVYFKIILFVYRGRFYQMWLQTWNPFMFSKTIIKNQTYTRDSVTTQVETAGWLLVPTSCSKQVQYEQVV